jgi:hypothetical protein
MSEHHSDEEPLLSDEELDQPDLDQPETVNIQPRVKPRVQLTAAQKEARDAIRKKADRIEAYFTHPISGPALIPRLPDIDFDIKALYQLSEDELDDIQLQIDRAYRNLVGCTLFSTGIHYAAPFIEQALVSIPYLRQHGINPHGFAKALKKNEKIPLILANVDIEFNQTIGTGAIGGAIAGFLETLHSANARNSKRRTTITFYFANGGKGITQLMSKEWEAEAKANGLKNVHELIQYLVAEEKHYSDQDAAIEARAREATGDFSESLGAEDAPDVSLAPPLNPPQKPKPVSTSRNASVPAETRSPLLR